MVTDAMLKSMGGNCINIDVVLERYADFCGQLRRDAGSMRTSAQAEDEFQRNLISIVN
jgi:hypothetical protein